MNKKDYIESISEDAERRFFTISADEIQVREEGEDNIVEGIAAVVNKETDLGWYKERIAPGAFDNVLQDDVRALFNHDPNFPLARTTAKGDAKLDLYLTKEGHLGYRYKTPNTTVGKDMLENIRSGIVNQSSFAFTIEEDEWRKGDETDIREIRKIKRLYDVSPVTYPAYPQTNVAARSAEKAQQPDKEYHSAKQEWEYDLMKVEQIIDKNE